MRWRRGRGMPRMTRVAFAGMCFIIFFLKLYYTYSCLDGSCGISRHYVVFSECTNSFHILQAAVRWLLPRLQNAGGRLPNSVGRV